MRIVVGLIVSYFFYIEGVGILLGKVTILPVIDYFYVFVAGSGLSRIVAVYQSRTIGWNVYT